MPAPTLSLAVLVLIAYVIGSIPFGLLIGLSKGIDVRTAGSNNIGASNVGRLLGRRYFWIVFGLDGFKGLLPMLAASVVVHTSRVPATPGVYGLWMAVGFAALVGHMFSLFLKFRGGKGVATTAGIVLGLWPYYTFTGVIMLSVFGVVFQLTRYISLGSMIGALAFPASYVPIALAMGWGPFGPQWPLTVFSGLVAFLVIYKHRSNIARLRAGTENRAVRTRRDPPA